MKFDTKGKTLSKEHDKIGTRLAKIIEYLNNGQSLNVQDLAEEFNVTPRTIQKDINDRLSYMEIKKDKKEYYIDKFYLGKLNFQDIRNFATLSSIKDLYPSLEENFLKHILDSTINSAYAIKGQSYEDTTSDKKQFNFFENAINQNQEVNIIFLNIKNEMSKRVIKPYKLLNYLGIWYLGADENGKLKTFTLSRIKSQSLTNKTFKPNEKHLKTIQSEDSVWFSPNTYEIIVKVDREVAHYFKQKTIIPNQTIIKTLKNGELLILVKAGHYNQVLPIVKYWIPHVKVVSPDDLREKLMGELRGYVENEK